MCLGNRRSAPESAPRAASVAVATIELNLTLDEAPGAASEWRRRLRVDAFPVDSFLERVFSAMHDGLVLQRQGGSILYANPASERILGLSLDELSGRTSTDPRWRAEREDGTPFPGHEHPAMVTLTTGRSQRDVLMWVCRPDGTRALILINAEPVPGRSIDQGLPEYVIVTFADITARHEAAQRERALALQVADLYNHAPCAYHSLDADGRYLRINDTELEWLGVSRAEVIGHLSPTDFMTEASRATFERSFPRLKTEGTLNEVELEFVGRQGTMRTVSVSASLVRDEQGQFVMTRSVLYDVSALVRLRTELAERIERDKRVVLENELIAVARLHDRAFVWVNGTLCRMFGYEASELLGQTTRVLYAHAATYDEVERGVYRNFSEGGAQRIQVDMVRKDGTRLWVDVQRVQDPDTGDVVVMFADLTPIRAAQVRSMAAHRMESVGRLAGGVAHEFNNQLQAVLGLSELALLRLPVGSPVADDLHQIQASARHAELITRRLMAYAGKQPSAPNPVRVDDVVSTALGLVRSSTPASVSVTWTPAEGLWPIRADAAQITDVLTSLLANARDAVSGSGHITVAARNASLADVTSAAAGAAGDEFVAIGVTDTGHGMTPEARARAFEPFFTTKPFGQNSGLGLSTVYGIVAQHNGWVELESAVGVGTTATVFLPRANGAATDAASAPGAPDRAALLIDADAGVRLIAHAMLRRLGYRVVGAHDCDEALAVVRSGAALDVVLVDAALPGGANLTRDVRLARPLLRVVTTSTQAEARDAEGQPMLTKPFTLDQLWRRLPQ